MEKKDERERIKLKRREEKERMTKGQGEDRDKLCCKEKMGDKMH